MKFKTQEHYSRTCKIHAPGGEEGGGVVVEVTHWNQANTKIVSIFKVLCGPAEMWLHITPAEARELAANLFAHAAEVDEQQSRLAEKEPVAA